MRVEIIRTNGTREVHEVGRVTESNGRIRALTLLQQIYKLIDCHTIDTVNLRDGRVMLVDDDGYEPGPMVEHAPGRFEIVPGPARKPVNVEATKLYHTICLPGTTHQIVGDVAIVRDEDFA